MCDDSIVILYVSFYVVQFEILTGTIFVVACFSWFIFEIESVIASMFLLG